MPDNAGEDLVSQVKIEGTGESAADLEALAKKGGAAFDDLASAADRADKSIHRATSGITSGAAEAAKGLQDIKPVSPQVARNLKAVETSARQLTASVRPLVTAVGAFTARFVALASAAGAAGAGLAIAARKVAQTVNGTTDALGDQAKAQQASNDASLDGQIASINYQSSLRQLNEQLISGKINYEQYSASIRDTRIQYQEQQAVALEVESATRRVKEENERLAKQAADTKSYQKLIDVFGGPLTSSLVQFGNNVEATRRSLTAAFSPAISSVIDLISTALTRNAGGIAAFAEQAAKSIESFVNTNGPAIQLALENIAAGAAAVFNGVLAAGPPLLDFFNNQLVPMVRGVIAFFQGIADTLNAIFGTKITAGFLIILLLLTQLSGGFALLFGLLRTGAALFTVISSVATAFGISLVPIIAIVAAVVAGLYLLTLVDWSKIGLSAMAAAKQVTEAFQQLPDKIGAFLQTLWDNAAALAAAAAQGIVDGWNAVVNFFATLPQTIGDIFIQLWEGIKATAIAAFAQVKQVITEWSSSVMTLIQPVIDAIKKVGEFFSSGVSGAGGGQSAPAFAGGGHVRGAGTSTSDSIWARLSDNEFVVRAKAVGKYGLGLLNALNEGKLDLNKFAAYAAGGLVGGMQGNRLPKMAFADGGPVNARAMQSLSLTIEGQTFDGLMIPEDVGSKLTKFAVGRQTVSAGRKPSWVGGRR